MKPIALLAALLPLFASSQDCKILRETDPYTKETRISSGFLALQGGSLTIDADRNEIDFFFTVPDKCFEDGSTVFIFFDGTRTRTTYRNAGSMNCDGYFHFKYKNTENPNFILKKLATLKVTQFVFTARDKKETIVSLIAADQDALMKAAECITTEAKALQVKR